MDRALSTMSPDALFLAVNAVKPQCVSRPRIPPTPVPTTATPVYFSPAPTGGPSPGPTPARKHTHPTLDSERSAHPANRPSVRPPAERCVCVANGAASESPTTQAPRPDMATWTCLTRAECSIYPPLGCCGDERRLGNGSSVNCGTKACLTYGCKRNGVTRPESECLVFAPRPPIALDTFNIPCGLSCFTPSCFYTSGVHGHRRIPRHAVTSLA